MQRYTVFVLRFVVFVEPNNSHQYVLLFLYMTDIYSDARLGTLNSKENPLYSSRDSESAPSRTARRTISHALPAHVISEPHNPVFVFDHANYSYVFTKVSLYLSAETMRLLI